MILDINNMFKVDTCRISITTLIFTNLLFYASEITDCKYMQALFDQIPVQFL